MKNILMFFAMGLFILALVLLAQSTVEYGIIAILVAIVCVMASCLIDVEEERNSARAEVAATHIRLQQLRQREADLCHVVNKLMS